MVSFADIAPVCIGHLARTVDDASHDGYHSAFEMGGLFLHFLEGILEIVHCPPAAGTGDIFRFVETASRCLHDLIHEILSQSAAFDAYRGSGFVKVSADNLERIDFPVYQWFAEVAGHILQKSFAGRRVIGCNRLPAAD